MDPVRALVVSDDPISRSGLAALLSERPDLSVVGRVAAREAPGAAQALRPGLAIWDLGRASEAELDALREASSAGIPILAVLASESQAGDAISAGARGLVFREAPGDRLAAAARALASGLWVLDEGLGEGMIRAPARRGDEGLTPREREVLGLLTEGLSNRAIAARLEISEHTAKFHVNSILAKLGAESRAEAIVLAARQGLVVL